MNGIPTENKDITSAREHFGGRLTVDYLAERFGYDTGGKVSVDLSQISQLDLQETVKNDCPLVFKRPRV